MSFLRDLRKRAAARPAHIVLSEGHDPRIVAGALAALDAGMGPITLVGPEGEITARLSDAGAQNREGLRIQDPETSDLTETYAALYSELRKHKAVSPEIAAAQARDPMIFSALMVRNGDADGTVGGAVTTSSETIRAALTMIGKAPDAALVSSFFLMILPDSHLSGRTAMVFGDCGMVVDPDQDELAAIAVQSAASCAQLLGDPPAVALLSFSTKGSARHASVTKVTGALDILRAEHPHLPVDGELQFDAAFVPEIGASKAPLSTVAGKANVFIFPDLNSGNIGYKIAQRIGGCDAIGPVLQGLNSPANDLSRGCTAADVTNMIAVTTLQAAK
ncbi:phosphate acetyltransferase [Sulfitobacter sp. F26169L]|uniref:phosphate acetyltransferase n=1 Tax=Sulfitobacter sp. F26169L TaxID=2996015 RepID=UPI002260CBF8|nr:phosphate acetyltransferase [Sulfitobacter sp. F26169L]MCX7566638.1 phosphate acetyltransferase [Sulfitobacter sp. F26169L]